jgi:hypothetical protein
MSFSRAFIDTKVEKRKVLCKNMLSFSKNIALVEGRDDFVCYTSVLNFILGRPFTNQELRLLTPQEFSAFHQQSMGVPATYEEEQLIRSNREEIVRFVEANKDNSHVFGIIDRDFYSFNRYSDLITNLQKTDSCDVESTILCCCPFLLSSSVDSILKRTATAKEKELSDFALVCTFHLGKLKSCQDELCANFDTSGIANVIADFYKLSYQRDNGFASFLTVTHDVDVGKWIALSSRANKDIDAAVQDDIRICINQKLGKQQNILQKSQWIDSDSISNNALDSSKNFDERNQIWQYCNAHDLSCFLSILLAGKGDFQGGIEKIITDDFASDSAAKTSFLNLKLGGFLNEIAKAI